MHLPKLLTTLETKKTSLQTIFWFTISMVFAASFGIQVLQKAFSSEYLITDDARQHIFWMQRFIDSDLFPNNLIADFYQSISPPGFQGFYHLMAIGGINPLVLNKILPIILGLITTAYCFVLCLEILPVPLVGLVGSLLLNQSLWLGSDLTTAITSGFSYPTFIAFLYYLLRRSYLGVALSVTLIGIFYAPLMLVAAGILTLRLLDWNGLPIRLSRKRSDYLLGTIGLTIVGLVILLYFFQSSEFGPTVTLAEARRLPEFFEGGRTPFFYDNRPGDFWLKASRSGIRFSFNPPLVIAGLFLPILLRFPCQFSLTKYVKQDVIVLVQILLSSLGLFIAAHLILFKLYLPSRYTVHSFKILIAVASAIAIVLVLDAIFNACLKRKFLALLATLVIGFVLIMYPTLVWKNAFPRTSYTIGSEATLYTFLQKQPKDIVIASLAEETDNIPSFAQRSVLVAWEYAIPYQMGYYKVFRRQAMDLIEAQYSPDLKVVQNFIKNHRINFFLLDRNAFTMEYINNNPWFIQWKPLAKTALSNLDNKNNLVILNSLKSCSVFESDRLILLEAKCITKNAQP